MDLEKQIAALLLELPYKSCSLKEISQDLSEHTLYIIGNGFDLMHGVPSSYYQFRDSLGKRSELREQLELWNLKEDLWADFEESLAHMDDEGMLGTIPDMMDAMGVLEEDDDDFSAANFFLAAEQSVYPLQVIQDELPRRFRKWINRLHPGSDEKPLEPVICSTAKYINFNYTEFIETIYGVEKKNIFYIHGDRRNKDEELILGHAAEDYVNTGDDFGDDEAEESLNCDGEHMQAYIRDQTSYDLYETASRYVGNYYDATEKKSNEIIEKHATYFNGLGDIQTVVVIGHSLSRVDYPYLKEIIGKTGDVTWKISWHDLTGLERIREFAAATGVKEEKIQLFRM